LTLQLKQKPLLRKLGERVFATEFIGYSNHGFIEGDEGVIVIDGGWFPGTTALAITELRKHTKKPVAAIIYTHLHLDHFGGMGPYNGWTGRKHSGVWSPRLAEVGVTTTKARPRKHTSQGLSADGHAATPGGRRYRG
jgi:glyoxylase-like metal-dependent hydrolase (beta-lactamase superfamily II)